MKRAISWLVVISATLGLVVSAIFLYKIFSSFDNPNTNTETATLNVENTWEKLPTLTYCEMANNPQKYDGQIVRLSARLSIGLEDSWFSDDACGVNNAAIVVKSEAKSLEKSNNPKNDALWGNEFNLVVIGRFKNIVYKDCCLIAPFQFEILKVEKRAKIVEK